MEHNAIIEAVRKGTLHQYSILDLLEMKTVCLTHVQTQNRMHVELAAVQNEISRQERAEEQKRNEELLAETKNEVIDLRDRLEMVERLRRPEYKTWAFWLSIIATIAATIALFKK